MQTKDRYQTDGLQTTQRDGLTDKQTNRHINSVKTIDKTSAILPQNRESFSKMCVNVVVVVYLKLTSQTIKPSINTL